MPFAPDFLNEPESIGELPEWNDLDAATMDEVKSRSDFNAYPMDGSMLPPCYGRPFSSSRQRRRRFQPRLCPARARQLRRPAPQTVKAASRSDSGTPHESKRKPVITDSSASAWSSFNTLIVCIPMARAGFRLTPQVI